MVVSFRVYKKVSANGKLTIYLGRRDYIDHVTDSDPIDGVLLVDKELLEGKQIFAQLVCSFRYGNEDDDGTMGLNFKKELTLADEQVYPTNHKASTTRLQERLVKKLGTHTSFPFTLRFPKHSPTSVTLQPIPETDGSPCGVEYSVRAYVLDQEESSQKRSAVSMAIRKIQYAPTKPGRQPCTMVKKDFMFSPGDLELEATLDQQLYHHGDTVAVNISIRNHSNKLVKKISVQIVQCIDIAMFTGGHTKARVAGVETTEGCPIHPGSTLNKTIKLIPSVKNNKAKVGVALDGKLKGEEGSQLASSTLLADENSRDIFGMVISYTAKVKLFLGAIGGELSAELPLVLMHPRPNMRKILKADTLADEGEIQASLDDPDYYNNSQPTTEKDKHI